jgi:hypothetical protein
MVERRVGIEPGPAVQHLYMNDLVYSQPCVLLKIDDVYAVCVCVLE